MADSIASFDFNSNDPLPWASADSSTTGTPAPYRQTLAGLNHGSINRNSTTPPPHHHPTSNPAAPVVDAQGRILNPRSCVTCRRRKVKCDKLHPCSNCSRAQIECIFPNPGRAPRKPRKHVESRDTELLARLRRLEGVVKGLGVDVGPGGEAIPIKNKEGSPVTSPKSEPGTTYATRKSIDHSTPSSTHSHDVSVSNQGLENKFGRLVVSEGRSRYVNTSFWASLNNEVEDLKGILNHESEEEDEGSPGSPHHSFPSHHQGWMFSYSSHSVDMLSIHPIPTQIPTYWNIFKDRVDPLVKVLHLPSISPTILASSSHLGNLSKGFEALLFSIYYCATTSLSNKECLSMLGEDRNSLLNRYRFGTEQALARATFLVAEEVVIVQAFVLFLMCLRRNSPARILWSLTGLLVRMSQSMGLHRDGVHFSLAPFEIEMRRRLWWQVCLLDSRAAEDHGSDPSILENSFDTKMPLNVNDEDISPDMQDLPQEHVGCTEMSFCLIRFEVANVFRRLNYTPPNQENQEDHVALLRQKEEWIQEMHDILEEKYLKHCDMTVPLFWVTATAARQIMSRMWLMVYHPLQRNDTFGTLSDDIRKKLFITSLENIEYNILLQTETRTMKWGWLFRIYIQWHALAILLTELTRRTRGPLVERAWIAVDTITEVLRDWASGGGNNQYLFRPVERLLAKAKEARQKALDEGATTGESQTAPSGENLLPGSVAHLLFTSKQEPGQSPNSATASDMSQSMPPPPPTYGELLGDDSFKKISAMNSTLPNKIRPEDVAKGAPESSTQSRTNGNVGRTESPTSYLDAKDLSMTAGIGSQSFGTASHNGTMDSTMSFGADNPNNFPTTPGFNLMGANSGIVNNPLGGTNPVGGDMNMLDMSTTFDANGDLDWANWDSMVRQFGMDVDQPPTEQTQQFNLSAWGGGVGALPLPTPGGTLGQNDWF